MLQIIRDRATGWIAYVIVFLISIPFVLWGVNEYFGGADKRLIAEINGTEIPVQAYQEEIRKQRERLAERFGGRIPAGLVDDDMMRELTIRTIVRDTLLVGLADREGYRVSPRAVARDIASYEVFRRDGVFDAGRYSQVLQSQRRSPAEFEATIRESIRRGQFPQAVLGSVLLPRETVEDILRLRGQRREIRYLVLQGASDSEIADDMLHDYYEHNKDRFRTPERVKIAHVLLDERDIADFVRVVDEDVRAFFEEQQDLFSTPDRYRASHIFLALDEDADEPSRTRVTELADSVMARLRAGEDFAEMAREISVDTLSAGQGGDLGVVERGDLDPEVERVLFGLAVGQIAGPVGTSRGLHILKVTEIDRAGPPVFEEVRDRAEAELRRRTAERRYEGLVERLINAAYEHSESLEMAAQAVDAEIAVTDWATREWGEGIAADPRVRQTAFSPEILLNRHNSELLELGDGRALILRVQEYDPPAHKPFEEVASGIRTLLQEEARREAARRGGERVLAALREGLSPAEAAREAGVEQKTPRIVIMVGRDDDAVPAELRDAIFLSAAPSTGGVVLRDGDYAVYEVLRIEEGEVSAGGIRAEGARLQAWYGERELEAILGELEEKAKVRVFRENL